MSRPAITLLITGLNRAGAETQVVRLAIGLSQRDWRVRVGSLIEPRAFTGELDSAGVDWFSLGATRGVPDPRMVPRLLRELRRHRPDVLACFMWHANILGRLVGRLAGVRAVVTSVRGERFGEKGRGRGVRLREWTYRLTNPLSRLTLTISDSMKEALLEARIESEERLHVLPLIPPPPMECDEGVRAEVRRELGVRDEALLWIQVARLMQVKGQELLLEAFAGHRTARPGAELMIVGGGPLERELRRRAEELGLADAVHLPGPRDDVPRLLCAADAFVLSSHSEAGPNVLLEAQHAGLPVVSTRVGAAPRYVLEGESGYLVEPGSAGELREAMDRLAAMESSERRAMGRRGRSHVRAEHSPADVLDRYDSLFRELIDSSSS